MRSRLTKVGAFLTLAAALAVGGATLASASNKAPAAKAPAAKAPVALLKVKAPAKAQAGASDGDNIQQGDQSTPDVPGAGESSPSSESSSETGSEVPGNDGPGGHADEPGNPNADHQFQGAE